MVENWKEEKGFLSRSFEFNDFKEAFTFMTNAPPALAAITTIPANNHLVCLSPTNFLSNEIITIEVIKLSSNAEKKKDRLAIIQRSLALFLVVILFVINVKS